MALESKISRSSIIYVYTYIWNKYNSGLSSLENFVVNKSTTNIFGHSMATILTPLHAPLNSQIWCDNNEIRGTAIILQLEIADGLKPMLSSM